MKPVRTVLSAAVFLVLGWGAPTAVAEVAGPRPVDALIARLTDREAARVLVVAHRGCWKGAPENSLKAIEDCVALGVDMVELDVARTKDGALVLMHDETVDRMTDGAGRVADLTLAEVRALHLRAGAGGPDAPTTELRVPTFAEAMLAARGRMLVNLDAKADVYDDAFAVLTETGTADHILMKRPVTAADPPLAAQVPFDRVFAMPILVQTPAPTPEAASGQAAAPPLAVSAPVSLLPAPATTAAAVIAPAATPATVATASVAAAVAAQAAAPPAGVELVFTGMDFLAEAAPRIAERGARVWVNTLRPQHAAGLVDADALAAPDAVWGRLIALGVDTIQTDEPAALIAYLRARGLR